MRIYIYIYNYVYVYVYIYIYIYIYSLKLAAYRRGQDQPGRRRSGAIPDNKMSWENLDKIRRNIATCGNMCAPSTKYCKMYGICVPSVKTPLVPTPSGSRRLGGADKEALHGRGDGDGDGSGRLGQNPVARLCAAGWICLYHVCIHIYIYIYMFRSVSTPRDPSTPCGGEVRPGVTPGVSRETCANNRHRRWGATWCYIVCFCMVSYVHIS